MTPPLLDLSQPFLQDLLASCKLPLKLLKLRLVRTRLRQESLFAFAFVNSLVLGILAGRRMKLA